MGPHRFIFLILIMLPLKRSVWKEIVLIALLKNEAWNKYLMVSVDITSPNSGRRYLLSLDASAYLFYLLLLGPTFLGEVLGKSTLFL